MFSALGPTMYCSCLSQTLHCTKPEHYPCEVWEGWWWDQTTKVQKLSNHCRPCLSAFRYQLQKKSMPHTGGKIRVTAHCWGQHTKPCGSEWILIISLRNLVTVGRIPTILLFILLNRSDSSLNVVCTQLFTYIWARLHRALLQEGICWRTPTRYWWRCVWTCY